MSAGPVALLIFGVVLVVAGIVAMVKPGSTAVGWWRSGWLEIGVF
jgi:hypothetical protein